MDIKGLGVNQKKMVIGVVLAIVIILLVWNLLGPSEQTCRTDLENYSKEFSDAGIIFKNREIVQQIKQKASERRNECSKYRSIGDGFDFLITKCNLAL